MTIQLHEGAENGKIHLPGPRLPLLLFACFRRRPISRVSTRGVVTLFVQRLVRAGVPNSMVPPPRLCARAPEHALFHMARIGLFEPTQFF